ncbi:MAG: Fe-S cluster assembly protein SufD [Abditibacteriaceae bacterium]
MSTSTLSTPAVLDPRKAKLQERMREAKVRYLMAFDTGSSRREREPEWLQARRASAIAHFEQNGFPTVRDEDWKYTDITPAVNLICEPQFDATTSPSESLSSKDIEPFILNHENALRLVFVNGQLAPHLCTLNNLPKGISLLSIRDAITSHSALLQAHLGRYANAEENAFVALNTALFTDGAFIHLQKNVVAPSPIHMLFVNTASLTATRVRNLVLLEAGAKAEVVESYVSLTDDTYLTNVVTEIVAGPSANLDHYKKQVESNNAYHIATTQIDAEDDSRVQSHTFTFGGAISRHDANALMDGENIEVTLNGLYLAGGSQIMDNHTVMDHAKPNCRSFEEYVGVLDGKAVGSFNGKIFVRIDAQKTDAKQSNRALLLSRQAEVNTKPQLEIFADDVKCTHGATIGELDDEALFYLRARGVNADTARDMLIYAFAHAVLDNVSIPELREQLEHRLMQRLRH